MSDEMLDVLDEKGNKTGVVLSRKEVHQRGLRHAIIHIWIYNSKGEILLQRRSMSKDTWPGKWDVSVGAHVTSGEKPTHAALRELHEELGIEARESDLVAVAQDDEDIRTDQATLAKVKDFIYTYLYKSETLPNKLQHEEVDEVKFVTTDIIQSDIGDPEKSKAYVPVNYKRAIKLVKRALAQ